MHVIEAKLYRHLVFHMSFRNIQWQKKLSQFFGWSVRTFAQFNYITVAFNSLNLTHNLSIVHYNVQSIFSKIEVLHTELIDFDILTFSETWLSESVENDDLMRQFFNKPDRKDRPGDSYGGVMLYVKEGIHYKRRNDLWLRNIESIWIEVANSHERVLVCLFYRPPNPDAAYLSSIDDSVYLATDTGM